MTREQSLGAALASDFAAIARTLGAGSTVDATLQLIVDAAVDTIDGCRHGGVLVLRDGSVQSASVSHPVVRQVDELQLATGEGPCLDAVTSSTPYDVADDLAVDPRYPRFGPQAAALGIRSALALRLCTDRPLGAMNLYSDRSNAFAVVDCAKAVILAAHCSTALAAAEARASESDAGRHDLHAALASRGVIGQAQGILMERERLTADEAFDVLRHASQDLNIKLRDVAQRLVDTGEDPRIDRAWGHAARGPG